MSNAEAQGSVVPGIIDSDGHIFESDEAIYPFFDATKHPLAKLRNYYLFPDLDGSRREGQGGDEFGDDAAGWLKFMDAAGISQTVLYPTAGLGYAFIQNPDWAIDLARAYNDWIYNAYLKIDPRLKAVALIPVHNPEAAADELDRAVSELGMVGAILPAPGLLRPYGDVAFNVLYERAQKLNTVLAVHGAAYRSIGLDFPMSTLGKAGFRFAHPAQPLTQMVQFISMLCEGVFLRFPELKVAFLEASCGWVPYWVERIDDRAGRPHAEDQVRNSPIYFHTELNQIGGLRTFVSEFGDDRLLYASDYPHEPDKEIIEILQGFVARTDIEQSTKEKILRDNTLQMYGMR
jgi:uncharacterized protein